jgi:hypothetical protein
MGLAAWLDLKNRDIAAFVISGILGFLVGTLLPAGPWAVYVPILVSYHLFLAWLVITAEHETGVSLPIFSMIMTHLACMALIAFLGMTRHGIPLFGLLKYAVAGLAFFEHSWLFVKTTPKVTAPPAPRPVVTSTAEDYQEWMRLLAQRRPSSMPPGTSMKAEYEKWLLARAQSHAAPSPD